MCGNNCGGNNCWWIIILILLFFCCGNGNTFGGCGNGCASNWNNCDNNNNCGCC